MCALFLICLWNINYLGKRGLISNRALTWNVNLQCLDFYEWLQKCMNQYDNECGDIINV